MKWLGLVIGLGLGLMFKKFEAALSLTIIGFAIGAVIDLARGANAKAASDVRFDEMERRIEQLSMRLAKVEARGGRAAAIELETPIAEAPVRAAPPSEFVPDFDIPAASEMEPEI